MAKRHPHTQAITINVVERGSFANVSETTTDGGKRWRIRKGAKTAAFIISFYSTMTQTCFLERSLFICWSSLCSRALCVTQTQVSNVLVLHDHLWKASLRRCRTLFCIKQSSPLLHHKKAFQEIKTSNSITTPPLHFTHKQFYFQQRCLVLVGHAHSVVGQHAQQTWFHRKGVSTSHLKEGRKGLQYSSRAAVLKKTKECIKSHTN